MNRATPPRSYAGIPTDFAQSDIGAFVRATIRKSLGTAGLSLDYAPFLIDDPEPNAAEAARGDGPVYIPPAVMDHLKTWLRDAPPPHHPGFRPEWASKARRPSPIPPIPEGARFDT